MVHRPRVTHQNADTLSCHPLNTCDDNSEARADHNPIHEITHPSALLAILNANAITAPNPPVQDIWDDKDTLYFLQHKKHVPGLTSSQRDRVQQRAKRYRMENQQLLRCLANGTRLVPSPSMRIKLIQKLHSELGHFGVKRTYSLLASTYHWQGIYADVKL